MNYDYTIARETAADFGLTVDESSLDQFDAMATAHEFTQTAVDAVLDLHLIQMHRHWTPSNWRWWQRIMIAVYFLTGGIPR